MQLYLYYNICLLNLCAVEAWLTIVPPNQCTNPKKLKVFSISGTVTAIDKAVKLICQKAGLVSASATATAHVLCFAHRCFGVFS